MKVVANSCPNSRDHSVSAQCSRQVLSSPTTKDFNNIMLFLLRQLDPTAAKGPVKMEEEVPALYKRLRYPFQISKSNLTAVGSPHTWPSILAALTWLVELLNYQEQAERAQQEVRINLVGIDESTETSL